MMEGSFVAPIIKPNVTKSLKSTARARNGQGQKNKSKNIKDSPTGIRVVLTPQLFSTTVQRRFTYPASVSSDASGNVVLSAFGCADTIANLGVEWTNFAQEFLEFRVRRFGLWLTPSTTNATSSTGPYQSAIVAAPWVQLKPTSVNTIYQSNQLVRFSTLEEKEIIVNSPATENAKLWNAYGTALPIDRDFGIVYTSIASMATTSRIFSTLTEMWVEFRTPQ